jgi:protein-S-isoprenylcysteine O-methyltransferase Ste14
MNKVIGCLFVSLALAIVLVVDVVTTAPPWTVYAEWAGLALSLIAAILYFIQARNAGKAKKKAKEQTAEGDLVEG